MSDDKIIIDADDIAAVTPPESDVRVNQPVVEQAINWETSPQKQVLPVALPIQKYDRFITTLVVLNFILTLMLCIGVGSLVFDKLPKAETPKQTKKNESITQLKEPQKEETKTPKSEPLKAENEKKPVKEEQTETSLIEEEKAIEKE
jgi:hypothetical protein